MLLLVENRAEDYDAGIVDGAPTNLLEFLLLVRTYFALCPVMDQFCSSFSFNLRLPYCARVPNHQ